MMVCSVSLRLSPSACRTIAGAASRRPFPLPTLPRKRERAFDGSL